MRGAEKVAANDAGSGVRRNDYSQDLAISDTSTENLPFRAKMALDFVRDSFPIVALARSEFTHVWNCAESF